MFFRKQFFCCIRVPQCCIDGRVRIRLGKRLKSIVYTARDGVRDRRILLGKIRLARHAAHKVRDLPRHGILCVVGTHRLGKVRHAHAVDGPAGAELQRTARQCLSGALAFFDALAHCVRSALQTQHRQHRRRVDRTDRKVLRCAGHRALHSPCPVRKAALCRTGQVLPAPIQLIAYALFRVDAVIHFQPGQPVPHVPDLFRAVSHQRQLPVFAYRIRRVIIHVHVRQQLEQFFGPLVALDLLLHLGPVLLRFRNVLCALSTQLAGHHRTARNAIRNAADEIAQPSSLLFPFRNSIVACQVILCLCNFLCAVSLFFQIVIRILRAALIFLCRRAERVDAPISGTGRIFARSLFRVGRVTTFLFQQFVDQFLIPRLVKPFVQPVELFLLAVRRIACLELLRRAAAIFSRTAPHLFQHAVRFCHCTGKAARLWQRESFERSTILCFHILIFIDVTI